MTNKLQLHLQHGSLKGIAIAFFSTSFVLETVSVPENGREDIDSFFLIVIAYEIHAMSAYT